MKRFLTFIVPFLLYFTGMYYAKDSATASLKLSAGISAPTCVASYNGDDNAGDGSWNNPLFSIMGCYDQFINNGTPGKIYIQNVTGHFTQACKLTDPAYCGIWLMGSRDPNYANPPPGWRQEMAGISFVCWGGVATAAFALSNQCGITAGDTSHPAIWLSDAYSHSFEYLSSTYSKNAVLIADSNGSTINTGTSSWNTVFYNCNLKGGGSVGTGPAVLISTNSDNLHFIDDQITGNIAETKSVTCGITSNLATCIPTSGVLPSSWSGNMNIEVTGSANPIFNHIWAATISTSPSQFTFTLNNPNVVSSTGGIASSDAAQAMVVNPNGLGSPGSGILDIVSTWISGGGIRYYGGNAGLNFNARFLYQENGIAPALQVVGCNNILVEDQSHTDSIISADAKVPMPGALFDIPVSCAKNIVVSNASADGPYTNGGGAGPSNPLMLPSAVGQSGILGGQLFAQSDDSAFSFGPVSLPNGLVPLTIQAPAQWGTNQSNCPLPVAGTPYLAPDGLLNAGLVTPASGNGYACFYSHAQNMAVGDNILIVTFAKSTLANGYANSTTILAGCLSCSMSTTTSLKQLAASPIVGGGGEWQRVIALGKVTVASPSDILSIIGYSSSTHPTAYYAPTAWYIPASLGYSQNEIARIALQARPTNSQLLPGQVGLLPGEQFKSDYYTGPALAPTGSCTTNGLWVLSQDGHMSVCLSGNWTTKI